MTVRLTPTESDTTPPPPVPAPPVRGDGTVTDPDLPAEGLVDGPAGDLLRGTDAGPATDSRRTVRESRRQRRRTAWLCAAVVAVCLALTIVVVMLARYRPVPTALRPLPASSPAGSALLSSPPSHGAAAPEGGTP